MALSYSHDFPSHPLVWGACVVLFLWALVLTKAFVGRIWLLPPWHTRSHGDEIRRFALLALGAALVAASAGGALRLVVGSAWVIGSAVGLCLLGLPILFLVFIERLKGYSPDWKESLPYLLWLVGAVLLVAFLVWAFWKLPLRDAGAAALLAAAIPATAVAAYRREHSFRLLVVRGLYGARTARTLELAVGLSDCLYPLTVVAALTPPIMFGHKETGLIAMALSLQLSGLLGVFLAQRRQFSVKPEDPLGSKDDDVSSSARLRAKPTAIIARTASRVVHPGLLLLPSLSLLAWGAAIGKTIAVFILLLSFPVLALAFLRKRRALRILRRALAAGDYAVAYKLSRIPSYYWDVLYAIQARLIERPEEAEGLSASLSEHPRFLLRCLDVHKLFSKMARRNLNLGRYEELFDRLLPFMRRVDAKLLAQDEDE